MLAKNDFEDSNLEVKVMQLQKTGKTTLLSVVHKQANPDQAKCQNARQPIDLTVFIQTE